MEEERNELWRGRREIKLWKRREDKSLEEEIEGVMRN